MALIDPDKLEVFEQEEDNAPHRSVQAFVSDGRAHFLVGRHGVDLEQLIPALEQGCHYHIPSRAEWSLHHMLQFLLGRVGPARVWVTSWGITQEPLNQVLRMLDSEPPVITELNALFDSRVKLQCPQAFQLLIGRTDRVKVRLARNHSKLLVLLTDTWGITVASSANLTQNERLEYYVISTDRALALHNRDWIGLELDDSQPFEAE